MEMLLKLHSEFGRIKKVIVHRPGPEIDRLTPQNTSELLFEDVPYLESMQKEHDEFTQLIKNSTHAKVYRLKALLQDILIDPDIKLRLLKNALRRTRHEYLAPDICERFSTAECVNILLAGLKVRELKRKQTYVKYGKLEGHDYLINPSPNHYFMRDPAAVVQSGVISSNMKFSGRQFESVLIRNILENHPDFKPYYNQIFPCKSQKGKVPTIEGGDVIVISPKTLAIGCSERTQTESIADVAEEILKYGDVERVYEIQLPRKRNYMHLDTVFSIIDENLLITFPDAINALKETSVYYLDDIDKDGNAKIKKDVLKVSFIKILKKEIPYLEIAETGAGHPDFASREQWYDGANVFAIGPRRVISYDRNKITNRVLREMGVEVLEINSSELSRGLGGPRCMTMPVERHEI